MQMTDPSPTSRTAARAARRAHTRKRQITGALAVLMTLVAISAFFGARAISPAAESRVADAAPANGASAPPSETTTPLPVATTEATVAAPPRPEPSGPATITVAAVGDMIFDRQVAALIRQSGGLAPLKGVAALLSRADVTVGNLESNLSTRGTANVNKDYLFRGDPRGIEGLSASGFDFLALGNNHVLDYGPDALADTITALDEAGIGYAGAGMDKELAWKPAVREVGGARVAFLSFSHILPPGFIAGDSRPGLAQGRNNMENVTAAIEAAKQENDYVLVSFHWGVEYEDNANAEQVRDARMAIDAGADMVLSHHPHVIQGIELYNGGLIAYSLGDFVFDHYSRKTGEAFILNASLGPSGVSDITCTPVYLDSFGAPAVVTGTDATVILERLRDISSPHGTTIKIADDRARVMQ